MTSGAAIDLATNTNRWGAPPSAVVASAESAARLWSYPEPYADALRNTLAAHHRVRPIEITTGCGSDGVLSAAIRALTVAGDRIAVPTPTFPMVASFGRSHGLDVAEVALTERYEPDVDAMLACRPRIAYVCAPNNPTGTRVERERLDALARGVDVLIVDQAYAEFDPAADAPIVHERILWVRTMSKAYGLAGARVGYGIGAAAVVHEVERVRGPYAVSDAGAAAAVSAVRRDRSWMRECAAHAVLSRDRLWAELDRRGLGPVPSAANFVFLPMRDAGAVASAMHEAGVYVRSFSGVAQVSGALMASGGEALRISVGPWAEMERALAALDDALRMVACA